MEIAFMIFGLGFFLYVIWIVQKSDEARYLRELNDRHDDYRRRRDEARQLRREQKDLRQNS